MIKLFITDLDGCITMPFQTPDWNAITQLRELCIASRTDKAIPSLTICSGRPMPYVEAVSQWLDMRQPMIFESGGGIYDMQKNELIWHPDLTGEKERSLAEIRRHVKLNYVDRLPDVIPEFTKRTDIGMVFRNEGQIRQILPELTSWIDEYHPEFEVHHTEVSINIISKRSNKGEGIRQLCQLMNLKISEVAYIGDTGGDIPALKIAGRSYAPKNAMQHVRKLVDYPLESSVTAAVLEAYRDCVEYNRSIGNS